MKKSKLDQRIEEEEEFDPIEGCCPDCNGELCVCGSCHTPGCEAEDDCEV